MQQRALQQIENEVRTIILDQEVLGQRIKQIMGAILHDVFDTPKTTTEPELTEQR